MRVFVCKESSFKANALGKFEDNLREEKPKVRKAKNLVDVSSKTEVNYGDGGGREKTGRARRRRRR
eukprot:2515296-Pleurochrysis_carterae.AAC.1